MSNSKTTNEAASVGLRPEHTVRFERWELYRDQVIRPLIDQARTTNAPEDWAQLARSMRSHDEGFQNSMYLFGSNTQWPKVLGKAGVTPTEIELAASSAQKINARAAQAARWQRLTGSALSREERCEEALRDLQQRLAHARHQAQETASHAPKSVTNAAWAGLSRAAWSDNPLFGPLTKRGKWDSVLERIGATPDEIKLIKSCGRFDPRQTYTPERWNMIQQDLEAKIAEARATQNPRVWASLARGHWEHHPDYFVLCRELGTSRADWKTVLLKCGLTEDEYRRVLFHRHSLGKVTFDQSTWTAFKQEHMLPLLEAARASDSPSAWIRLSRGNWEKHEKFFAISCFLNVGSWYEILKQELGVTAEEQQKIEAARRSKAVQDARSPSADEKRRVIQKLGQLLAHARDTNGDEDWAALSSARWMSLPGRLSLCREYGRTKFDWAGVLAAAGASRDEISTIVKRSISLARRPQANEVDETRARLIEAIRRARECNQPSDWSALSGINWMDKAGGRELARTHGRTTFDWQGVLRHVGLSEAEVELVRIEAQRASYQKLRSYVVWNQRMNDCLITREDTPRGGAFRVRLNVAPVQPTVRIVIDTSRDGSLLPSDAQLYRLLLGTRVGRQDWDALADLYQQVFPRLKSTLSTAAGLSFVSESIGSPGWPASFPRVIASIGSGIGSLYRAVQQSAERIKTRHQELPTIHDVDPSDAMRSLSPNPNKIAASAGSMHFEPESLDAMECSSVLAMGQSETAALIMKASSALKIGGLLWLKVDGARFGSGFEKALSQLGFSLLAPSNTRLEAHEYSDPNDIERVGNALRSAHFIFAVKTQSVQTANIKGTDLIFTRTATADEQFEKLKESMRALRSARDDTTFVSLAQEFLALAVVASKEAITQNPHLWFACLWAYARVLYPTNYLPKFPIENKNDPATLKAWADSLQRLLDADYKILSSSRQDKVSFFISECREACIRLSTTISQTTSVA